MSAHALTELQLTILRIIWDRGEATAAEVREALSAGGRDLAPSTVATLLGRLEDRNVLERRGERPRYVYRAAVSESEVRRSVVTEFTERATSLFRGDVAALVSRLVAESEVEPGELARIRKMIAREEAARARATAAPAEEEADARAEEE